MSLYFLYTCGYSSRLLAAGFLPESVGRWVGSGHLRQHSDKLCMVLPDGTYASADMDSKTMIEAARSHPMSQQVKTQDGGPHLTAKQSESDSEHPLEICNQPCYWSAIANNCRFLEHCFCACFPVGCKVGSFIKTLRFLSGPRSWIVGPYVGMRVPFKLLQFQYDQYVPVLRLRISLMYLLGSSNAAVAFFLRDRLRKVAFDPKST